MPWRSGGRRPKSVLSRLGGSTGALGGREQPADEERLARVVEDVAEANLRPGLDDLIVVGEPRVGLAHDPVAQGVIHDGTGELAAVGGIVSQDPRILPGVGEAGAGDLELRAQ